MKSQLARPLSLHPGADRGAKVTALRQWQVRSVAVIFLGAASSVFWVAATLTPAPEGYGTHRQLGYAGCLMPLLSGYPCPTCGMTTAFAHAVRGQLVRAFHAQPAGFALAVLLFVGGLCSLCVAVTGQFDVRPVRLHPARVALMAGGVLVFGWVYKILTFSS